MGGQLDSRIHASHSTKNAPRITPRMATPIPRSVDDPKFPEPMKASEEAALEADALAEVEVLPNAVLGAVFVGTDDDVKLEDCLDVVEGNESDAGWLARLQNRWARVSTVVSSPGQEFATQSTVS